MILYKLYKLLPQFILKLKKKSYSTSNKNNTLYNYCTTKYRLSKIINKQTKKSC